MEKPRALLISIDFDKKKMFHTFFNDVIDAETFLSIMEKEKYWKEWQHKIIEEK